MQFTRNERRLLFWVGIAICVLALIAVLISLTGSMSEARKIFFSTLLVILASVGGVVVGHNIDSVILDRAKEEEEVR